MGCCTSTSVLNPLSHTKSPSTITEDSSDEDDWKEDDLIALENVIPDNTEQRIVEHTSSSIPLPCKHNNGKHYHKNGTVQKDYVVSDHIRHKIYHNSFMEHILFTEKLKQEEL